MTTPPSDESMPAMGRFSLRAMFVVITCSAAACFVVARAFRLEHWAIGLTAAGGVLALLVLLQAICFSAAYALHTLVARFRPRQTSQTAESHGEPNHATR